ncbi:2-oxo acid dehydrogenase subunit E2, partial [Streptomyces coelicoflavus]
MTDSSVREFKMPDVGEGLTEAEILKWYVQPGDTVTDGQVVCEVETAKAAVELPIPYDGVVRELHFPEGTTVDVGTSIIAVAVGDGAAAAAEPVQEAVSDTPATAEAEEPKPEGRQPVLVGYGVSTSSTKRRPRKGAQAPADAQGASAAIQAELNGHGPAAPAAPAAPATGDRPLAKPPVRKLAKDLGVDLATVVPTGPDGIITREDVHAAVPAQPATPEAPA